MDDTDDDDVDSVYDAVGLSLTTVDGNEGGALRQNVVTTWPHWQTPRRIARPFFDLNSSSSPTITALLRHDRQYMTKAFTRA